MAVLISDLVAKNSIKCGKWYLKPKTAENYLIGCVKKVVQESLDPKLRGLLGSAGSATLLKIGGVHFAGLTKHQMDIGPGEKPPIEKLDTVRIVTVDNGRAANILFDKVSYSVDDQSEEYADIALFSIAHDGEVDHKNHPYFFPIKTFDEKSIVHSLLIAIPRLERDFTLDDDGIVDRLNVATAIKDCKLDIEYKPPARYLRRFTYTPNDDIPEDGWSGGAVFSLLKTDSGFEFVFDGLITRAGNGYLYVVGFGYFIHYMVEQDSL